MCKRCSAHVDLRDYDFTATVSKNFKTRGNCVLHEGACLLNTDSTFGHAVIKGKIIGRIAAEELELHKTFEIKGSFKAGKLILPAGVVLRWPETVVVNTADIAGEFIGNFRSTGTITVRSTGRLFGNVEGGGLAVESGAIVVGMMKIGIKEPEPTVVISPVAPAARIVPLAADQLDFALPAH
jgi:cytoskeletal protein CcmA (bactofilin family)